MEPQVNEKPKLKDRFVIFFHNMKDLFKEEDVGENAITLEETFPEEDMDTLKALENCQKKVASYEVQHQKTIDAIETMSKTTTKAPKARTAILSSENLEKAKEVAKTNSRKVSKSQLIKDDDELSR